MRDRCRVAIVAAGGLRARRREWSHRVTRPPSSPPPPRSRPAPAPPFRLDDADADHGRSGCRGRARRAPRRAHRPGARRRRRGSATDGAAIDLRIAPGGAAESYRIAADAASVVVTGADAAGLFYGVQTLGQLIAPRRRRLGRSPRSQIEDAPRFAYRGVMLDVARHFHPGRDRQGLHRPRGGPEVQRAAPAPHRRPGLAHPARLAARSSPSSRPARRSAATRAASTRRPTIARSSSTRHPVT